MPHILIIDDDKALLLALVEVLQRQMSEVKVDKCHSPQTALEYIKATDYDAIISDIKMPGMDGLTLLAEIKSLRPNTPVLLMTSLDERDVVLQALRRGAYDFIQKPIDAEYLTISLQRAIQMHKLNRQVVEQQAALERHAEELTQTVQQAVADAQAAQRRLAFLAEASTLLASSLDFEQTLSRVARLAVLYMADYCIVDVLNEDGRLSPVAVAHVDRRQEALVREIRTFYEGGAAHLYPAVSVLENRQSELCGEVSLAKLRSVAVSPRQLEVLRELNPHAWMLVPLIASDQLLGVLTFGLTNPKRRYSVDDLALAEDLTRRAALAVANAHLYNEAQEALQMRDQFLSIAAHELKTPMTSIIGTAQLLTRRFERENNTDVRLMRNLQLLTKQTQRLNRLVASLLDLSRLEAGQFAIEKQMLNVVELTQRVVDEFDSGDEKHKLEFNADTNQLLVLGDELRLEQVLQNLLQNAIKYSPEGGKVLVKVGCEDKHIHISVTDQGVGIPSSEQIRLFTRFYRVENKSTQQVSGLGLGLYVVKEIVSLHNGSVEVQSREGEGSTFSIWLPLYQENIQVPVPINVATLKRQED